MSQERNQHLAEHQSKHPPGVGTSGGLGLGSPGLEQLDKLSQDIERLNRSIVSHKQRIMIMEQSLADHDRRLNVLETHSTRCEVCARAWSRDNKFQLQRLALEGKSSGDWKIPDAHTPRTVSDEKLEYYND